MTRKKGRRRVKGSDGKTYNPRKQKDNGHRAHENRVQTMARRTRWKAGGCVGWFWGGLKTLGSGAWSVLGRLNPLNWRSRGRR